MVSSYQEYKQVLILNSNVHHYATRNNSFVIDKCKILEKKDLFVPYSRTLNYGQKSIRVVGPKIWNDIPLAIRNNTSQTSFKFHLKKHLYDLYD